MDTPAPNDTWSEGGVYDVYMGRWSRLVAHDFLVWLAAPSDLRWLDVGCGTGALTAAIAGLCAPAALIGVDPAAGFLQTAQAVVGQRAIFRLGRADDLPVDDAAMDMTVSGLALNFMPNPHQCLAEMVRVTKLGGRIALYVWDYASKMEFIRYFWDAAVTLDPAAAPLDEAVRFPVCHPFVLHQLFADAGLHHIEQSALTIETHFSSFDDFWQPFLGGQGPAPSYVMQLDASARARLRELLSRRLPQQQDGTLNLAARAWAICGTLA